MRWYNAQELVVQSCSNKSHGLFSHSGDCPWSFPPLYSFLFMGLRARSFCVAPAIFITTRRTKIRQGGGGLLFYLFIKYYIYHALLGIYKSSIWVKCAQKNDHSARLQQDLRVHPSSGSNIHRCALWTGKWQGGERPQERPLGWTRGFIMKKAPKCRI